MITDIQEPPSTVRFEFTEAYVARLRNRDSATWQHFQNFFRPRIAAKIRAKFPWDLAEELSSEIILAVIESIDRGEPRELSGGLCLFHLSQQNARSLAKNRQRKRR